MLSHVSATSIKLFRSCPRRWYERYVLDKREPSTRAMQVGSEVHRQLEEYLLHGTPPDETHEGRIAKSGIHHLCFSESYHVELSLEKLPIENLPVPFKGFIDVYVHDDVMIEVIDHKTTSNFKYALTGEQLSTDVQMIIYAAHGLFNSTADAARLTHICYSTKQPYQSQRTSTVVTRAHVEEQFREILETAHEMMRYSELPVHAVEKNKNYCWAYGKRCPYFDECQITTHKGVKSMSDKHLSVIDRLRGTTPAPTPTPTPAPIKSEVHLYINCAPLGVALTPLAEGLKELITAIEKAGEVTHIGQIRYMQGYDALSAAIKLQGIPAGEYFIHSRSPLYDKCCDALHQAADRVVIAQ